MCSVLDVHFPKVPVIWVLYTLSYLDRANIGNAKEGGMEAALHMTDTEYSIVLLVFFVRYLILTTALILTIFSYRSLMLFLKSQQTCC